MLNRSILVVLAGLMASPSLHAADVRGTFSTLIAGREQARGGEGVHSIPIYELVGLEVDAVPIPGMDHSRVVLQGWGRLQLGDDALDDTLGDLGLLYLQANSGDLSLTLGRQHLVSGVGRMAMIDGIDARYELPAGLSVEGFWGFTVHPQLRHRTDNWQGGGRVAFDLSTIAHLGELGVGYLMRQQRGALRRHELGVDAFYAIGPTRWVGLTVLNMSEMALVEARLAGSWQINNNWVVTADGEHVVPDLMLPMDSIFSVFAAATHNAFGGEVRWTPSDYWAVDLAGHALLLAPGGDHHDDHGHDEKLGYRTTLRAITYRDAAHRSLVGLEGRRLDEGDRAYLRGRAFSTLQLTESLRAACDLFFYRFDTPINDQEISALAQGSVIFDFTPAMRLSATVAGGTTPWATVQLEGMLRFAYGWDVDLSREVGP